MYAKLYGKRLKRDLRPHHVIRPLFPPVIIRRPGLRPRPHDFVLPDKDDCNFIPRILYCTLLQ